METWVCDQCGKRFVVDFDPAIRCAAHGEDEHCHAGHQEVSADGKTSYAVASPDCLPFATREYTE